MIACVMLSLTLPISFCSVSCRVDGSKKMMNLVYLQIKELSNVKEEVYGALDSFIAWELEFPLVIVKKALAILEDQREWKKIIQVISYIAKRSWFGFCFVLGTFEFS